MSTARSSQPQLFLDGSPLEFGSCLVDSLAASLTARGLPAVVDYWPTHVTAPSVRVRLTQEPYELHITLDGEGGYVGPVSHSRFCPALELRRGTFGAVTEDAAQWFRTGVACVVVGPDNHVLITQRAMSMRSFPGVWVSPGGHLDCGETLPAAGLREVQEETGLALDPDTVNFLCGWESNYPIDKPPVRQHLVLDFIGQVSSASPTSEWCENRDSTVKACLPKVTVEPTEVARAVWLSSAAVRAIVSNTDGPSPAPIWTSSPADSAPDLIDNIRSNIAEGTRFALATFLSRLDAGDALNPAAARPRSDL